MTIFQLLQWKAAVKLEKLGMQHSSRRSVRKHAAKELDLKSTATHDEVIAAIEDLIDDIEYAQVLDKDERDSGDHDFSMNG